MDKKQLRDLIKRVLVDLDLHSESAENLLMGTAAQESGLGEYIRQLGSGPALGIFQMEPNTFKDIVQNYLQYKPELAKKVMAISGANAFRSEYLEYNLALSICMCRVHYLRMPVRIPDDLTGWAKYWKEHYNTRIGKGTEKEFVRNFKKLVL
ncbi:hypothetical protein [Gabonibacter massiliensis]|uniref:hypothetical protein n=1 Tax=Gabonibacter massiliensis TaxID=1720195 RepID=UPI00073EC51F|nr:hypothetical protein [Gabonibacter massiliensis]